MVQRSRIAIVIKGFLGGLGEGLVGSLIFYFLWKFLEGITYV